MDQANQPISLADMDGQDKFKFIHFSSWIIMIELTIYSLIIIIMMWVQDYLTLLSPVRSFVTPDVSDVYIKIWSHEYHIRALISLTYIYQVGKFYSSLSPLARNMHKSHVVLVKSLKQLANRIQPSRLPLLFLKNSWTHPQCDLVFFNPFSCKFNHRL